jgi:YD repeat-containing protein
MPAITRKRSAARRCSPTHTIAEYAWVYNLIGQLTSVSDHGLTQSYTYDGQGELTSDGTNSWTLSRGALLTVDRFQLI